MSKEITKKENKEIKVNNEEIITSLVLNGDLSKLTPMQKVEYYNKVCESLGLNPLTKPFDIIKIQGKEVLYAKKDCSEQLRKINGISVIEQDDKILNDVFIVNVKLQDKTGRLDTGKGAVSIIGLKGDALANAMMKAETKAKRRGTLSISGLGITDETELETIPELNGNKIFSNLKKSAHEINEQAKKDLNIQIINNDDSDPDFEKMNAVFDGKTPAPVNWDEHSAKIEVRKKAADLKSKMSKTDVDYFMKLFACKDKYTQDNYLWDLEYLKKIENGETNIGN